MMTEAPLLETRDLSKSFVTGAGVTIDVLRGVDFRVEAGETVAILGQSGVGKSTLLHVLGTLDRPTSGSVSFRGEDVSAKEPAALARFRNECLGFVFQSHHLLPEFTALENVMMPGLLRPLSFAEMRDRARAILGEAGLEHRVDHPVGKLSGGERQRVAVARAMVLDPPLLLADEPTGNLDPETGERIGDLLIGLNEARGSSLVVVTHNADLAARMHRSAVLQAGGFA
jgi:lipoprotein-releasing system ATP-binding protein